jgi:riboflavin biosynthesis pyrimidine reductase
MKTKKRKMMTKSTHEISRRPVVTAAFTLSWDGRVIEQRPPEKRVDAVLCDAEEPAPSGGAVRVLVSATGKVDLESRFFKETHVIVYSPARMARRTQAALAVLGVGVHLRAHGKWPLREVLEHLLTAHRIRRVAVALNAKHFRELATDGLLDELRIAWRPSVVGEMSLPPITGLDEQFLPRGIVLDLLRLERRDDEFLARYRVQGSH